MAKTRSQFEVALEAQRNHILAMAADVDRMIVESIDALTTMDIDAAERVIAADDVIDNHNIEIESDCIRLIALQQPISRDLRLIGTVLELIIDLERVGDHAVDIAKVARKLAVDASYRPLVDLPRMAGIVRTMLHDAMTAFVNHDLVLVDQVIRRDDEIDLLFHCQRDELHRIMKSDPSLVVQASYLLFVAHYLERIADHIVNIAERVYYVETGVLAQLARDHGTAS